MGAARDAWFSLATQAQAQAKAQGPKYFDPYACAYTCFARENGT